MTDWYKVNCENHGIVGNNKDECDLCGKEEHQERHYKTPQRAARALDVQEGGDHYKGKSIQPVEYIMANGIGFMEGNVIKYVTRWRDKGGIGDLRKAVHFLQMLIEHEIGDK